MAHITLPTPLYLAQANLTDPSPFCRHLMLLTESSAALRLMFECGLLKRNKTVVLVGSKFSRDANSELRMVRQINEVKRAMQSGHTVVLVNHEGIFPSLYDVLNMRYTTKRSSETGKVTRMLRLAVGNRSQWCSVGEGFKIVVVVESKDAYEKLDLPLLNRFEKQVLRAEDVLEDTVSRQLWEHLKMWVNEVEERTRVKDPFIGLYSQTLASLVHLNALELKRQGAQQNLSGECLNSMKQSLAKLLSPLARIRGALDDQASEGSSSLGNVFYHIDQAFAAREHLLVLTFSSSHDFELVLAQRQQHENVSTYCDPIALGGVTSEREFVQALKRSSGHSIKIVQCDPNTTPQETIEHTRYLALEELGPDEIAVFIVHLPPGGRKKRRFNVDFQVKWRCVFIDDLVNPDFMSTVLTSPLAWADQKDANGTRNLDRVLRTRLSLALAQARPPLGEGVARMGARERMQQTLKLLDEPVFADRVVNGTVRQVLGMMQNDEHVEMVARGDARAGTVADSLALALETIVTRAFALALRWYDVNSNLALLAASLGQADDQQALKQLWITTHAVPSPEFLATNLANVESAQPIRNWGRPGFPLEAQFPWSWRVFETFEQALGGKKAAVVTNEPDTVFAAERLLAGLAETVFGPQFSVLAARCRTKYLHDVCGFQANRRTEISREEQSDIVGSWLERCDQRVADSVPLLHVLFHRESWALFSLLSIRVALTTLQFPDGELRFAKGKPIVGSICEFLLSSDALNHPQWSHAVSAIAPHMHDQFLLEDGPTSQQKWADVLLRHIFSFTMGVEPARVPNNLQSSHWFAADSTYGRFHASFNSYLEQMAREVVAKPWFNDEALMADILTYVATETNNRAVRLSFLAAVFKHQNWAESMLLRARFENSPVLFSLALDLAEDVRFDDGDRETFFPDAAARVACQERESVRLLARGELSHDIVAAKHVYARAFALNELFERFGDFGASERIRSSRDLLMFFQAPQRYLAALQQKAGPGMADTPKQQSLLSVQRTNCFALMLGEQLFREATEILNEHMSVTKREEDDVAEEAVRQAIRNSRRDAYFRLFEKTFDKVLKATTYDRLTLWNSTLGSASVSKQFHNFVVALLMATAGKTSSSRVSLTHTGVPMFLKDIITLADMSWWAGHRRASDDRIYSSLIPLVCALETEDVWTTMFDEGKCTEQDRFVYLLSLFSVLLTESEQSTYLMDLLRGKNVALAACHLPGMVENELAELSRALGYVGWWACPNGHRYAVGECTMPMQQSRCPECGASVGGQDHEPVRGVTRLDDQEEQSTPGYQPVTQLSPSMDAVRELRAPGVAFFQFIFHIIAIIALRGPFGQSCKQFLVQGRRERNASSIGAVSAKCEKIMRDAWRTFRLSALPAFATDTDGELLFFALTCLIARNPAHRIIVGSATEALSRTPYGRATMENQLQTLLRQSGASTEQAVMQRLTEVKQLLGSASHKMELVQIVSNEVLMEAEYLMADKSESQPNLDRTAWRYRAPIDFANLANEVEALKPLFPFLDRFCRIEPRLKLVIRLADILEWVNILYEALSLRKSGLSRDDASRISNVQALETLPLSRREYALDVLARFCSAFNETFVLVPNLYECQRNPFLTEEAQPRVDLSGGRGLQGTRMEMSFDTPVSFSLSAIVQGDADAQSLCLFQLIRTLQQLNNTVLEELSAEEAGQARRRARQERAVQQQATGEEDLPVTSMSTPRPVILSRLVAYDRRDLIPILACCSGPAYGLGPGVSRSIDLNSCSATLKRHLLAGKQPLRVVIPSYEFAGEARRSGTLAGLRSRVPQLQMNRSVVLSITTELDTDSRVQPLWELVDSAIGFLSGVTGFDAETSFGDFAKNVLGVDEQRWDEIAPQPVQQHVKLCHLAALFALLEEAKDGSPMDAVRDRYKQPLPAGTEADLRMRASALDLDVLLPIMKELLTARLVEDTFPEDASLAEYLEYCTDVDLTSLPWFNDHFPASLTLAHAYSCWNLWMDCT